MSEGGLKRALPAAAALVWLLVVLAIAAHQWQFWRADRLDVDVLALLPRDEQSPEVAVATERLADAAARQVVVVIGAPAWESARRAAAAWRKALRAQPSRLQEQPPPDGGALADAVAFYRPWRDRLLTSAQREQLAREPSDGLLHQALAALYQPGLHARLTEWAADPLGLWPQWWSARAAESRARPRDGELWLAAQGREWIVLRLELVGSAFSLDGEAALGDALRAAAAAARATEPTVEIAHAGVPLYAEAAAVQASREVNTIGWGSLAAVMLLAWLAFRSPRPILLVSLSLLVGCAAAVSATAWVFGKVHLVTLVFGASLVGVGEDYGIHYFASRQAQPAVAPRSLMRHLLPGLTLALLTSVLAYLTLGIPSFPGLRQMALFSAVGLVAAMLTVVCWFPWLDGGALRGNAFATAVGASLDRWPRLVDSRRVRVVCAIASVAAAVGLFALRSSDDVRQLQSSPVELMREQRVVAELLALPSPAQFYLVRGSDPEELLQREERLTQRLDAEVARGRLAGYSAVSGWLPSAQQQHADALLNARVEGAVLAGVAGTLGEAPARPTFAADPLDVQRWLAHPVSSAARAQWLGRIDGAETSVVLLRGLHDPAVLPALAEVAAGLDGVRWVDKPGEISALLGRYRVAMGGLLVLGHVLVLVALALRYGRRAWRAWLPAALASVATLALLGALGQPLQLFNVLALLLLLGVGVDYGILLLEHAGDDDDEHSAWLAVALGAGSTWLAFGLLALSSTPALRAFGLTLGIGLFIVLLLAPTLRAPRATVTSS